VVTGESPEIMEKKNFEFTKTVCERYDIHFEHGGWAIFTIDENGGLFNCHSDFGDYNYSWPNHGRKSFKEYIIKDLARDSSYFLSKVASRNYFNYEDNLTNWKLKIIELRKEGECTKEQARDAWGFITDIDDSLSSDYLQSKIFESEEINALCDEPWNCFEIVLDYSPYATIFANKVMPMFAEILKKEIESVNQELDTSLIEKSGNGFTPLNLQRFNYAQVKDLLKNGQKIIARLGRAGTICVNWISPKEYTLLVQRNQYGEIVTLGIKETVWAKYNLKDFYEGDNIFLAEDYYVEVLDWRMEMDKQ